MKIELKSKDESFWVTYPGTDVRFKLRRLPDEKRKEFVGQCTEKKLKENGDVETTTDFAYLNQLRFDYYIMEWENIVFPGKDETAPCTLENKINLPEKVQEFIFKNVDRVSISEQEEKKTN